MRSRPRSDRLPAAPGRPARWVTAAFGVLFIGLAVAIVALPSIEMSIGPIVIAALLSVLGVDAVHGALRDRRSLLSRIGPLP
jgi:uncharacterized membrane protein HdeD (DUF308 family)